MNPYILMYVTLDDMNFISHNSKIIMHYNKQLNFIVYAFS